MKAPSDEIYDKSTQGLEHVSYNSVAIFIRLAVVASQRGPMRNPAKFYENSNL